MAQNSARLQWQEEEVDAKLGKIMEDCYNLCFETAKKYTKEGESESAAFRSVVCGR